MVIDQIEVFQFSQVRVLIQVEDLIFRVDRHEVLKTLIITMRNARKGRKDSD